MLHEIDLSRTDLNLLVLFETVFAERHVGRSADRLRLSPSAVSHGLGRLRRLLHDPLFLKTPKGVVPTERAISLAPSIADALQKVREVVSLAEPFDPATSTRRMTIGAPDGVTAVFLADLLADIGERAPGVDMSIRQLLPIADEREPDRAWRTTFSELDANALDVAIIPSDEGPARFARHALFEEDFVLVMRPGHAFLDRPTLDAYCASRHLVVSMTGDPQGFVDVALARQGLERRVALTVPNFMFACAMVADSDLLCAVPRRLAERFGGRLGLAATEAPLAIGRFRLNAFVPKAAMMDEGIYWLIQRIADAASQPRAS